MAKYLKLQSIILCLCLILSMFSGISAFAADPLELVSWDADGDFITLDFNQAINTTDSVIELVQDGVDVEFTLEKADANSNVQADGVSTRYTYLLTPVDGMVIDAEYEMTLVDVKSSDGASSVTGDYKMFTVAEIASNDALVNIKAVSYAVANTWGRDGDRLVLDPFTTGSSNMGNWALAGALVGNDTTAEHFLPKSNAIKGSQNWTEKDYTMKVTFKETNLARVSVMFGIARSLDQISNDTNTTTDVTAIRTYDYTNMTGAHDVGLYLVDGLSNRTNNPGRKALFERTKAPDLDYEAGVELKLSSKDDVVRFFVDGKKFMDAAVEVAPGHPFFACHSNNKTSSSANTSVELYDFQVTQCRVVLESSIDKDVVEPADTVTVSIAEALESADIKLLDAEGNEVENCEAALSDDGTQATITFSGLEYRGEYKIAFKSAQVAGGTNVSVRSNTITVVDPPTEIYSFGVDGDVFEGTVDVEAVIANNTQAEDFAFTATVAIYDNDGKMVAVNGSAQVLATGESCTIAVENFVCDTEKTYTAKCFVWDSLLGMNTIFEASIGE